MLHWFTTVDGLYTMIATLLSCLVSLFPLQIKAAFTWSGRNLRQYMLKSSLKSSEEELRMFELVHNNAYYLLLWLVLSVWDIVSYAFWISLVWGIVNIIAIYMTGQKISRNWVDDVSPALIAIMARSARHHKEIVSFLRYNKEVSRLKMKIAHYKQQLGTEVTKPRCHAAFSFGKNMQRVVQAVGEYPYPMPRLHFREEPELFGAALAAFALDLD